MINRRFLVDYTMKDSRMCSFKWWHDYCCRWYIFKKRPSESDERTKSWEQRYFFAESQAESQKLRVKDTYWLEIKNTDTNKE